MAADCAAAAAGRSHVIGAARRAGLPSFIRAGRRRRLADQRRRVRRAAQAASRIDSDGNTA